MKAFLFIMLLFFIVNAKDVTCVLRHSASACLDDKNNIDVHTNSNDSIVVNISGLGKDEALLNKEYWLKLFKKDNDAYYYIQESSSGIIIWAYFLKSNCITYTKIRAFPVSQLPDSYIMIGKCK